MKKGIMVLVLILMVLGRANTQEKELVIYAYDSFVSWGLSDATIHKFEEKCNCKVTVLGVGDAGAVLSKAILEKDNPKADIVVGIDNNLLARALEADILIQYKPKNLELIPEEFVFDKSYHVIPFDYGFIAFVYDSEVVKEPPKSLKDLTDEKWRKKIILEDPRTSSPGLAFLYWTIAVYGEDYLDYWRELKPNILTISEGWDTAYGMFLSGEAPIVLSYATSPAYHVEYEDTYKYKALAFEEGNYMQIEGMGILKGSKNQELAKEFIEFMLTEDFQKEIPLTNWMFPVNPKAELPESFKYAAKPEKILVLNYQEIEENKEKWLNEWASMITEKEEKTNYWLVLVVVAIFGILWYVRKRI